jgi:hypothetical protein
MTPVAHYVVLDGNDQIISGGHGGFDDALRCARLFGGREIWLVSESELVWSSYDDECHCGEPMADHRDDPTHIPTRKE